MFSHSGRIIAVQLSQQWLNWKAAIVYYHDWFLHNILWIKASFCHCCTSLAISREICTNTLTQQRFTDLWWQLFNTACTKSRHLLPQQPESTYFLLMKIYISIYSSRWIFRRQIFHRTVWCSGFLWKLLCSLSNWHRAHLHALYLKAWHHSLALTVEKGSWAASHIQYGSSDLECYTRLHMSWDAEPPVKWLMFIGSHLLYSLSRILLHLFRVQRWEAEDVLEIETQRPALASVWQKTMNA